jgi:uncharacterized protein YqgV (UPF0045/DUF77 family)
MNRAAIKQAYELMEKQESIEAVISWIQRITKADDDTTTNRPLNFITDTIGENLLHDIQAALEMSRNELNHHFTVMLLEMLTDRANTIEGQIEEVEKRI